MNNDELIQKYEKKHKRDQWHKISLIIIIIILLLLCFLCFRLGKIGYNNIPSSTNPTVEIKTPIIKVSDDETEITNNTELNIFENFKFNNESKIAPKSYGEYQFVIENVSNVSLFYDIKFEDAMTKPVNMKYRLKIDNVYIRGNEKEYISIDSLNVNDIIVLEKSNNIFTLEWYWEDDDKADTYVGSLKSDEYYNLKLTIQADVYNEK